jgi:hypothetical protein
VRARPDATAGPVRAESWQGWKAAARPAGEGGSSRGEVAAAGEAGAMQQEEEGRVRPPVRDGEAAAARGEGRRVERPPAARGGPGRRRSANRLGRRKLGE